MASECDIKPVALDEAIKKLLSGWTVRPIGQPFHRGGASYRYAIDSIDGELRVVSDSTWRHLSRWIETNGHRALIKRDGQNYLVRGKSGEMAGHLRKTRQAWILQMHATLPESYATSKEAKAAALKHALRY